MEYRVGFSKDIHRLAEKRKLIIAGVVVPFEKGELAHSDGDVVYHAIAESILGALALGDLGTHFPDSSDETKDMDSAVIVSKVVEMMEKHGYRINNIDVFISLEQPKLKSYISQMRNNVTKLLHTDLSNISIKAGTNEGLDDVGHGLAIRVDAVVLLNEK